MKAIFLSAIFSALFFTSASAATLQARFEWELNPDSEAIERAIAGNLRLIRTPDGRLRITALDTFIIIIDGQVFEIPRPPFGWNGITDFDGNDPLEAIIGILPIDNDFRIMPDDGDLVLFAISGRENRLLLNIADLPGPMGAFELDTVFDDGPNTAWTLEIIPLPASAFLLMSALGAVWVSRRQGLRATPM